MVYKTPPKSDWYFYLKRATFSDMTEELISAKTPIYIMETNKYINLSSKDNLYNYNIVNNYMKSLEKDLYNDLRKSGISVQKIGKNILIVITHNSLIELNSPDFSKEGIFTLNSIADILKRYEETFIEISGYSDSMINQKNAKIFSLNIAEKIGVFFSKQNINSLRLFINGKGSSNPIASQDMIGRLTNRRIEIKITPVLKRFNDK